MIKKSLVILLLLTFECITFSQQNSKYEKWQRGSYFRGYNILYESNHFLQDFVDLKNFGGNLFQIGVFAWMNEDSPYDIQQNNIDSTDKYVDYCRQSGMYYVLAVRSGPGAYDTYQESHGNSSESRIWDSGNTNEQLLYRIMLNMMVSRYLGDTLFAGINLVIEPRPKVNSIPANNSELYKTILEDVYNIHMDQVYQYFISGIRTIDPQLPVIIENFAYSTPELFPAYIINDPYVIYSAHNYMPIEYTNADPQYSKVYPGRYFNITFLSQQWYNGQFLRETIFSRVRQFQQTTNAPVFIGEFGMKYPQKGASQYLRDVFDIAKDYGWHWALWDWRRGPGKEWNIENFGNDPIPNFNAAWMTVLNYLNPSTPISDFTENKIFFKRISFYLFDNYPNPFNPSTTIYFNIPSTSDVKLIIYDILGREVAKIVNGIKYAGNYSIQFNGIHLSSGIYFYKLDAVTIDSRERFTSTKRMILTK